MALDAADLGEMVRKLREKAQAEHAIRISPEKLNSKHHDILLRAINNTLHSEIALFTYAQIIDGLPIADVAWDRRQPGLSGDHPIDEHEELCPGSMDKAVEYCGKWKLEMLSFNPKTLGDFERATTGSKAFETRLIELVAVALHQFGALLYQLDIRLHNGDVDSVLRWIRPRPPYVSEEWAPLPPRSTIFSHPHYLYEDIYPEGVADIVGYWAEDRIMGGVVLFDRKAERTAELSGVAEADFAPPNIYLHPCREDAPERPTQLLDEQQGALVDFLLAEVASPSSTPKPCPLPVIVGKQNRVRVDWYDAITVRGVYRDIWERSPLTKEEMYFFRRRPQSEIDYPEIWEFMLKVNEIAGNPFPKDVIKGSRLEKYMQETGRLETVEVSETGKFSPRSEDLGEMNAKTEAWPGRGIKRKRSVSEEEIAGESGEQVEATQEMAEKTGEGVEGKREVETSEGNGEKDREEVTEVATEGADGTRGK